MSNPEIERRQKKFNMREKIRTNMDLKLKDSRWHPLQSLSRSYSIVLLVVISENLIQFAVKVKKSLKTDRSLDFRPIEMKP